MLTILLSHLPASAQISVLFTPGASHTGGANSSFKTALIDFMKSAKKSIEIAVFSFSDREIIEALNTIQTAGVVTIKVVVDDNNGAVKTTDGSVSLSSSVVTKFDDRPDLEMHHKFVIIDRGESDAAVWTGSANFNRPNMTTMNNNAVILRSKEVAATYGAEFDYMFTNALFHTNKTTPSTTTVFTVSGIPVEIRFAPRDQPVNRMVDAVNSLSQSLYFAIFASGNGSLLSAMIAKKSAIGANNFGWFDKSFTENSASAASFFSDLSTAGYDVRKDDNSDVMHHKYMVIDGAKVFTGSMNFTVAGNADNDENSVYIQDAAIAKAYMAELARIANTTIGGVTASDWKESSSFGSASSASTTSTAATEPSAGALVALSYPNPFNAHTSGSITIESRPKATIASVKIFSPDGRIVTTIPGSAAKTVTWNGRNTRGDLMGSGMYYVEIETQSSGTARGMLTLVR